MSYDLYLHNLKSTTPQITLDHLATKLSPKLVILSHELDNKNKYITSFTVKTKSKNSESYEFTLQPDNINFVVLTYALEREGMGVFKYVVAEVCSALNLLVDDPQSGEVDLPADDLMPKAERLVLESTKDVNDPDYTVDQINSEITKEEKEKNIEEKISKLRDKYENEEIVVPFHIISTSNNGFYIHHYIRKEQETILLPQVDYISIGIEDPIIRNSFIFPIKEFLEIIGKNGYEIRENPTPHILIHKIDESLFGELKIKGKRPKDFNAEHESAGIRIVN